MEWVSDTSYYLPACFARILHKEMWEGGEHPCECGTGRRLVVVTPECEATKSCWMRVPNHIVCNRRHQIITNF